MENSRELHRHYEYSMCVACLSNVSCSIQSWAPQCTCCQIHSFRTKSPISYMSPSIALICMGYQKQHGKPGTEKWILSKPEWHSVYKLRKIQLCNSIVNYKDNIDLFISVCLNFAFFKRTFSLRFIILKDDCNHLESGAFTGRRSSSPTVPFNFIWILQILGIQQSILVCTDL